MATNSNAVVRYYASDMILNLHSDASYLSAGQGRSRAGAYNSYNVHQEMTRTSSSMKISTSRVQISN